MLRIPKRLEVIVYEAGRGGQDGLRFGMKSGQVRLNVTMTICGNWLPFYSENFLKIPMASPVGFDGYTTREINVFCYLRFYEAVIYFG